MKESETTNENDIIEKSNKIVENESDEKQLNNKNNEIHIKTDEKEEKEKQKKIKNQTNIMPIMHKKL